LKAKVRIGGLRNNAHTKGVDLQKLKDKFSQVVGDQEVAPVRHQTGESNTISTTYRSDIEKPHRQEAKTMGMGHETYAKCKFIDQHASEDDKQALRRSDLKS
jgi:hypothetical protein